MKLTLGNENETHLEISLGYLLSSSSTKVQGTLMVMSFEVGCTVAAQINGFLVSRVEFYCRALEFYCRVFF